MSTKWQLCVTKINNLYKTQQYIHQNSKKNFETKLQEKMLQKLDRVCKQKFIKIIKNVTKSKKRK